MFGEKLIFGQKEVTMDAKGRIVLPAFTYAEVKDEVSFVYPENGDYVRIFLYNKIEALINMMIDKQLNTSDFKLMEDIKNVINNVHDLCISNAILDKQKRVIIPKNVRSRLQLESSVKIIGATDTVYTTNIINCNANLILPCVKIYKYKNKEVI